MFESRIFSAASLHIYFHRELSVAVGYRSSMLVSYMMFSMKKMRLKSLLGDLDQHLCGHYSLCAACIVV